MPIQLIKRSGKVVKEFDLSFAIHDPDLIFNKVHEHDHDHCRDESKPDLTWDMLEEEFVIPIPKSLLPQIEKGEKKFKFNYASAEGHAEVLNKESLKLVITSITPDSARSLLIGINDGTIRPIARPLVTEEQMRCGVASFLRHLKGGIKTFLGILLEDERSL